MSIKPTVLTRMYTTAIDSMLTAIVMALEERRNLVLMVLLFAHTVQGATQEVKTDIQKMLFVSLDPISFLPLYNFSMMFENWFFSR